MASFEDEFHDCAEGPPELFEEKQRKESLEKAFTNLKVSSGPAKVTETLPGREEEFRNYERQSEFADEIIGVPDTIDDVEKSLEKALAYKEEGNTHFRNRDYDNATQAYSYAIDYCPTDEVNRDNLATFYGNRAAAYFSVSEHELTIEDCTKALELKPNYVKVLARRMQSYEVMDKIEEALADSKKILEVDPSYPKIAQTTARLQKLYDEKMSKLKDEALGKLKELGNTILGNFGMSLDNFKMAQDPNTGSWSISMNNGK